jgi:hypothetical protein
MIPTHLRNRLPGGLSYPISASVVSEMLDGAPRIDRARLSFIDRPHWRATVFHRWLRERTPYPIFEGSFRATGDKARSGASAYWRRAPNDEYECEFRIYPVRRELRSLANRLLREQGLPLVRNWLDRSRQTSLQFRGQTLRLVFDVDEEQLTTRTHTPP